MLSKACHTVRLNTGKDVHEGGTTAADINEDGGGGGDSQCFLQTLINKCEG